MKRLRGSHLTGLAVLAMLCVSLAAPAAERGFYVSLDYGSNRFDRNAADFDSQLDPFLECSFAADGYCDLPASVSLNQTSLDKKASGFLVWVGYQFSPWFAVEGAYVDLGRTHHAFDGTIDLDGDGDGVLDGPRPLSGTTSFHTRGPTFAAVGSLPLGDYFSLEARAGLFFADSKLGLHFAITDTDGDHPYDYGESDSKTALFYGISGTFWATEQIGVHAGYTEYKKGSFDRDVKQYSLGLRYSYGY